MISTKQILTSHIFSTYKSGLKEFPVDVTLSKICSVEEDESKGIIVDGCSTEEYKSEYSHKHINKQKYAKNETYYEEYSVTDEVPSSFNIYKCVRKLLNILDVTYEQVCITTTKDK